MRGTRGHVPRPRRHIFEAKLQEWTPLRNATGISHSCQLSYTPGLMCDVCFVVIVRKINFLTISALQTSRQSSKFENPLSNLYKLRLQQITEVIIAQIYLVY